MPVVLVVLFIFAFSFLAVHSYKQILEWHFSKQTLTCPHCNRTAHGADGFKILGLTRTWYCSDLQACVERTMDKDYPGWRGMINTSDIEDKHDAKN